MTHVRPQFQDAARHLDGNRRNNTPDNLCWGTVAENTEDRIQHVLQRSGLKGKVVAGRVRTHLARILMDNGVTVADVVKGLGYHSRQHMANSIAAMKA